MEANIMTQNKDKVNKYYYAKGIFVGILFENILLLFFLIMMSTKDGFAFFGLFPIWFFMIVFSIASIVYFKTTARELK